MKVILKVDVEKQGKKGQVIEVADGYGRNYLIRRGLAIPATPKSLAVLGQQKAETVQQEDVKSAEALELKEKMQELTLNFKVKENNGKMFGSVSSKEITEALSQMGIKIDKRKIVEGAPINEIGVSVVKIELYPKIIAEVRVIVESE